MRAKAEYGYDLIAEHFSNDQPILALARKLNELDGKKSVKGWEMSIYRYKNENKIPSRPKKKAPQESVETNAYHYDAKTDEYHTFLSVAGKIVTISGEQHRAMKESYSNMVGKAESGKQICREHEFPEVWFGEYRRKHNWSHDMSPFTDEEIKETSTESLVDDLLSRKKNTFHRSFQEKKWKAIEKSAEKYDLFEEHILNEFKGLVAQAPVKTQQMTMVEDSLEYALVISPTDFHWGKYGWADEVGETYNFEEARKRLMEKTQELICRLPSRPEKIIMATGSDWFHVDNDLGTTTKGTPQDMCGSPAEILMTGCRMAREHIELLRQVAPVEVVFMPGNHDRMSAISLMMYLSAVYENTEDCKIVVSPSTRQYVHYGNNLLGFIHGDGARNLEELMSCEQRELWGQCKHHTWFHGHLHHRKVLESKGCLIVQLPSLAGHDRYHARQGYTTSIAGLSAHFIDKEKGLVGTLFAPVEGEH
tara:strand:+ start:104 stop:1534 length:1431 start_codon:yes stop_codon:yes gene_type:complete